MQLNPADFNRFLGAIGQRFEWRRSFICPCLNPATQSPRVDCPQCAGKGRIWAAPIPGTAGVPSQRVQREYARQLQWESGDMVLTVPSDSPLYKMGEGDRVLQLSGSDPFSINLRKGINDKLPWTTKTVDRAFYLDDAGAVVEAGLPMQQPDGALVFAANPPPSGTTYSVTGTKLSEFFVYKDFPSDRGHHFGAQLPLRVQLRRFDLYGR